MAKTEEEPKKPNATGKRKADDVSSRLPLMFPEAGSHAFISSVDADVQFRDVSLSLQKLPHQALFLRPTQMGKSFLFYIANLVYNINESKPEKLEYAPKDANSWFVLNVTFVDASGDLDEGQLDRSILTCVENAVQEFLDDYDELKVFYETPAADPDKPGVLAGKYLGAVDRAVKLYGKQQKQTQRLMVTVDEYEKPAREVLLGLIGSGDEGRWVTFKEKLHNYRAFFSTCKKICAPVSTRNRNQCRVWVTGVTPLALNLISDFNPERVTFRRTYGDIIGYRRSDVNSMLNRVHDHFPFKSLEEKGKVRAAIDKLANRLYFKEETPLYHTRMINCMMNSLLDESEREDWLCSNLSKPPEGREFQEVQSSVFQVIHRQDSLADIARELSANRQITSRLNETLNLADVLKQPMLDSDYLTLLVHLGIASVRRRNDRHVFEATSTFFRIPFFKLLVKNALAPLFNMGSLREIYENGVGRVEEFMNLLPRSGMKNLIQWAHEGGRNKILELQFQEALIGELADSLWDEDVVATQEDMTGTDDRTDVRISGKNLVLLLELKQHCKNKKPPKEGTKVLRRYRKQLAGYAKVLTSEEGKKTNKGRMVAAFLVIMYDDGASYYVERTTFNGGAEVSDEGEGDSDGVDDDDYSDSDDDENE